MARFLLLKHRTLRKLTCGRFGAMPLSCDDRVFLDREGDWMGARRRRTGHDRSVGSQLRPDLMAGTSLPDATAQVSAQVGTHDIAVLRLSPK